MNSMKFKAMFITWFSVASMIFIAGCTEQAPEGKSQAEKAIKYLPYQSLSPNITNRAITETEFSQTLHPVLVANCSSCHTETATVPALPYFSDPNPLIAFNELYNSGSVDLIQPFNSRIVQKLQTTFHNCWTVLDPTAVPVTFDCGADALTLQTAVEEWAVLANVGSDVYAQLCSYCHGLDGNGKAAQAATPAIPARPAIPASANLPAIPAIPPIPAMPALPAMPGLNKTTTLAELTSLIESTMPPYDPSVCVGPCAADIAQYVIENFNITNGTLVVDPVHGLPEGPEQIALLCAELQAGNINNVIRDTFCNGAPPQIQSLTDLQAALGLSFVSPNATGRRNNGRRGNPAFVLTGHSSSLVSRFVSAINPRAIIFTPPVRVNGNRAPNPGFVAMGFVRGDQFAEIAASDPVTGELTFYLVTFKQACNLTDSCTPGDLLTPAIESNWVSYTVYSQTDLQNTIVDCLHCHQPAGPGTGSILRMQELRNPWTHFFRNNRPGGVALLNDFVAAHGTAEDYAGIPAQLIDASDPAELEDLVRGNGFNQPNEFISGRIEAEVANSSPGQPENNDIPGISPTWQRLYNNTVLGQAIPVPYHDVKVTDSTKLAALTASYRAFVNGTLAAADLPDIRDVFLDSMLPDIGFNVMAGLDGQQVITQACAQCHNSRLNQNISRARFNVDLNAMSDTQGGVLTGTARDAELTLAVTRLNFPVEDVRKMPPEQFKTLTPAQIQAATSYLCSQMTVQSGQCTNVPAFVAAPAVLPGANAGGGASGGFPGFPGFGAGAAGGGGGDD